MGRPQLYTKNGHSMYDMVSLLQKAIRRGDVEIAGYAANELRGRYNAWTRWDSCIRKMMMRWTQKRTHTYDRVGRNPCPFFVNEGEFTNGNRTEYIHRYFV